MRDWFDNWGWIPMLVACLGFAAFTIVSCEPEFDSAIITEDLGGLVEVINSTSNVQLIDVEYIEDGTYLVQYKVLCKLWYGKESWAKLQGEIDSYVK